MSDPNRLAGLRAVKLAALVGDHLASTGENEAALRPGEFAPGAALLHDDESWVLVDDRPGALPSSGLGGPLAWAMRHGARRLHVVVDDGAGGLARRAAGFSLPVSVWTVSGRSLVAARSAPLPVPAQVPSSHLAFEHVIAAAGAEPVVEHGVLCGEVLGLEVCRVVDDPDTGGVRLDIGIGDHDREAFRLLHGERPPVEALADVVATVGMHRRDPTASHPLARLARERLLRAAVIRQPSCVGATSVVASPPPEPRPNLKDPVPCVAIADADGGRRLLVLSTGVDLDAVPACVDARLATGIADCALVVPIRDAIPVQRMLAAAAVPPVEVLAIDMPPLQP
ncbi:MAG: hypothetical protein RLY45_172 [Actinomycetota bacterium]